MNEAIKPKAICGRPVHSFFTGKDKYLRLQKHCISDITPPISENESTFILVTDGGGTITINGVTFPMKRGSFVWLQSYHTFTIKAYSIQPLKLNVCVYDYPLSSFLTFHEPASDTVDAIIDAPPIITLDGNRLEKIEGLFDEFEEEDSCFDPGSSLIKVAILGQFANFFIHHSLKQHRPDSPPERPLGWKAALYISAHFAEDITAQGVASHFGSTAAALNRELRTISGYSFSQFLNRVRVNIASIALLYEGMSLSYVAAHSGFPSDVAFYRIFKKYMGTTPIEYRKLLLNDGQGVYRGMIMSTTLMEVLNYSYSSYSEPVDIKETSKKLFISESVIRDLVYENFSSHYKDLAILTRIRHAEALLLTTDLPIVDIAVNVGFNCSRSFTRTFKRIYGMAPSEYRERNRGGRNQNEKEK